MAEPRLLIADEPTTALDVTTQAVILDLLRELQRQRGMSMLFITHDLGVVAAVADRVVILYLGQVAEHGPVEGVLTDPHFPMRKGLLNRTVCTVRAVNEVSFDLWLGETMGLVGESGCGKTTLAQTLIGLIRAN